MVDIRTVTTGDAAEVSAAYAANREFLAPWEPVRDEAFFTVEGQRDRLAHAERETRQGLGHHCLIRLGTDVVGTISLSGIARGPAQSANLGYWVAREANGRGVATRAVALMLAVAFDELGLHRVQAGTLMHNAGSQKVLERNGFERIGLARSYLLIAGSWQDHVLFQRLAG